MDASTLDYGTFMENHATCLQAECPRLWVFGYGSLLWKPDLEYSSYRIGYIENYERRFNQGNETFRGTKDKPGRVANLEERQGSKVWGLAYEICGREGVTKALRNLYLREIANGGYKVTMTTFHPRKCRGRQTSTKCCTKNYHNVPLPHPPRGPTQANPSQAVLSPQHRVAVNTPPPSSLSLSSSHSTLREKRVEFENDCPCFIQKDLKELSTKNISNYESNFSIQNSESLQNSFHVVNKSSTSSEYVEEWSERKFSLDYVNHTKQIDQDLSNVHDYKYVTLQSRFSNHHIHKSIGQNAVLQPITSPHKAQNESHPDLMTPKTQDLSDDESPMSVLLFTVTKVNSLYLGSTDVDNMASQIVNARGTAGTNAEYVLRISDFIKKFIPEDDDCFLFNLDYKINQELLRAAAEDMEPYDATIRINS